jgi:MOSC domain-containing protein YiiM
VPSAIIVSLQIGLPRTLGAEGSPDPSDRVWTTAFFKEPVAGPVRAEAGGLVGDGQADRKNHGGSDKAVLAYAAGHYAAWRAELPGLDLAPGAFGENLTVEGIAEADVCIGDVWVSAAGVALEVSQPRRPCWKLSRARRTPELAARVVANGRSGWYLRVIAPGELRAGEALSLRTRPHPEWTVARANRVMHHARDDAAANAELAAVPSLSAAWREVLAARAAGRGA